MNGNEAFTFVIMVLVFPLFLVVLGTALLIAAPVLIPCIPWLIARWLLRRVRRGR